MHTLSWCSVSIKKLHTWLFLFKAFYLRAIKHIQYKSSVRDSACNYSITLVNGRHEVGGPWRHQTHVSPRFDVTKTGVWRGAHAPPVAAYTGTSVIETVPRGTDHVIVWLPIDVLQSCNGNNYQDTPLHVKCFKSVQCLSESTNKGVN